MGFSLQGALRGLGSGLATYGEAGMKSKLDEEARKAQAELQARIAEQASVNDDARATARLIKADELERARMTDPGILSAATQATKDKARAEVEGMIEGYGGLENAITATSKGRVQYDEEGNPISTRGGGSGKPPKLEFIDGPEEVVTEPVMEGGKLVKKPVIDPNTGAPKTRKPKMGVNPYTGAVVSKDGVPVAQASDEEFDDPDDARAAEVLGKKPAAQSAAPTGGVLSQGASVQPAATPATRSAIPFPDVPPPKSSGVLSQASGGDTLSVFNAMRGGVGTSPNGLDQVAEIDKEILRLSGLSLKAKGAEEKAKLRAQITALFAEKKKLQPEK